MKKGLFWFSKLSKEDQVLFCQNFINCPAAEWLEMERRKHQTITYYLNRNFDSFYDFICYSFTWSDSPQGDGYWSRISKGKPQV